MKKSAKKSLTTIKDRLESLISPICSSMTPFAYEQLFTPSSFNNTPFFHFCDLQHFSEYFSVILLIDSLQLSLLEYWEADNSPLSGFLL